MCLALYMSPPVSTARADWTFTLEQRYHHHHHHRISLTATYLGSYKLHEILNNVPTVAFDL